MRSQLDVETGLSAWPLPQVDSLDDLARVGAERSVLGEIPQPADLFVQWSPAKKRFVHAGIVVTVEPMMVSWPNGRRAYECCTIECIATTRHSAIIRPVRLRERRLSLAGGDRVVRWANLEAAHLVQRTSYDPTAGVDPP